MKKINQKFKLFISLYALAVLFFAFTPVHYSFAQVSGSDPGCSKLQQQINALGGGAAISGLPGYCTVNSLSLKVISIFFYTAGGVAVLFIMIGGFQYIVGMSTGGDEAIGQAKKTITYAVIGLVVVVMAGTIVLIVYNLVTGNNSAAPAGATPTTNPLLPTGATTNPAVTPQGTATSAPTFTLTPSGGGANSYIVKVTSTTDNLNNICGGFAYATLSYNNSSLGTANFIDDQRNGSSVTFQAMAFTNINLISVDICGKTKAVKG